MLSNNCLMKSETTQQFGILKMSKIFVEFSTLVSIYAFSGA